MDFAGCLGRICDEAERLKAEDLARLSGLSSEELAEFASRWPEISVARRRRVVEEMVSLAEDNVEYNFDRVFLTALDDSDASVRRAALSGLWENESPSLIGRLIDMLSRDPDAAVRSEAALDLGRFVLLHSHGKLRDRYFAEVEAALRMVIADEGEIPEVRGRAIEAIGPHDAPWSQDAIERAYASGVHPLAVGALHAMGSSCQPRWLPTLVDALSSEDAELRYEAAVALGSIGDESAVIPLTHLLADDDQEVRSAATAALGEIGGSAARNALMELMDSPSETTREAAASALAAVDFKDDPLGIRLR